jgi:hypothetical protein
MTDTLLVHLFETNEDLLAKAFDNGHINRLFCLLRLSESVLQTAIAELHHSVLNDPVPRIHCIEKVQ